MTASNVKDGSYGNSVLQAIYNGAVLIWPTKDILIDDSGKPVRDSSNKVLTDI